ncbi:MAG TPA: CHASE3 domain-containing protein [Bryobacteraceae bacterium]
MSNRTQAGSLSRRRIIGMLLIASAMVIVIGFLSSQTSDSRKAAVDQSAASTEIRAATDNLLLLLTDAETAQRGYLLTGRDAYMPPYQAAVSAIPAAISQLEAAARARPNQATRVAALMPVLQAKLEELAKTMEAQQSGNHTRALEMVYSGRGKFLMDDIRARCGEIRRIAEQRASDFSALAERRTSRLSLVSIVGSMVLLGIIGMSSVTIINGLAHREHLYHEASASAEFLRVTLSSIGDAVIATDASGRITLINPAAENLTGWSEKEAIGKPISEVFRIANETSRKPAENPVERAIATGAVSTLANHTILISKDGRDIPIDDSGAPIRMSNGKIQGGVLVFRDISERRQAERQLRESNEHLKDFVSAAAHDLRSPLKSVTAIAQLMSRRLGPRLDADGNEQLQYVISGTERMMRLLDDLLAYAQASHFELSSTACASLEHALHTALDNLRAEIEGTRATVTASPLPEVAAHETHLVQLFQNLIGNALKYRSETAPVIRIACERENANWVIRVTDNGIGIDPQYTNQIFLPFRRLHGSDRAGSGIGLATCQKIVTGYGGRIWVDSAPGQGSTFSFSLPVNRAAVRANAPRAID